jgi:hypothetical protein
MNTLLPSAGREKVPEGRMRASVNESQYRKRPSSGLPTTFSHRVPRREKGKLTWHQTRRHHMR